MRVGLMADIHGNAHALAAVLEQMAREGVERLLVAGDLVGYYHQPGEVLRLLEEWRWQGVRGNHEEMLADWIAGQGRETVLQKYGSGLRHAAELPAPLRQRLLELPPVWTGEVGEVRVVLCHGIPGDTRAYVYPDADAEAWRPLEQADGALILCGHTHYPVVRRGRRIIVNPGSVGQPRDRLPGASWALWDLTERRVELRRTRYDPSPVLELCQRHDPAVRYLQQVLRDGETG